jgi:hypothetical protein
MAGNVRKLGTFVWHATDEGKAREDLFVCPTGMEYIDRRFETGKSADVAGNRERIA